MVKYMSDVKDNAISKHAVFLMSCVRKRTMITNNIERIGIISTSTRCMIPQADLIILSLPLFRRGLLRRRRQD
jgi:hypothetical protein